MTKQYSLYFLLFFTLFLTNCQSDSAKEGLQLGDGVLRGMTLGMSKSSVKSSENGDLQEEQSDLLVYEISLDKESFAELAYHFNRSNKLNKIELDAYTRSMNEATSLEQKLETHFNKKYKKRNKIWSSQSDGIPFTAFVQKVSSKKSPGVFATWEAL